MAVLHGIGGYLGDEAQEARADAAVGFKPERLEVAAFLLNELLVLAPLALVCPGQNFGFELARGKLDGDSVLVEVLDAGGIERVCDGDVGHESLTVVEVDEDVGSLSLVVSGDGAFDGVVNSPSTKPKGDEVDDGIVPPCDFVASKEPAMTPVSTKTGVSECCSRPCAIVGGFLGVI